MLFVRLCIIPSIIERGSMKTYSLNLFLALMLFTAGFVLADINPVSAESRGDVESLVKQSLMVWNTGNTAIADQLYSPDIIVHLVDQDNSELNGTVALMDYLRYLRTAYPDMKFEPDHMSIDGNKVTTQITFTGTNMGPRGDLPPTKKAVKVSAVLISQITDGEISEEWLYINMASVFKQLGFTLTPPSVEEK
jgi:steroid delta-isomerase-like uncharacterized protein